MVFRRFAVTFKKHLSIYMECSSLLWFQTATFLSEPFQYSGDMKFRDFCQNKKKGSPNEYKDDNWHV